MCRHFADDLLLFAKATLQEVDVINVCFEMYMQCSGQLLNREKLWIHFSRNTSPQVVAQLQPLFSYLDIGKGQASRPIADHPHYRQRLNLKL